MGHGFEKQPASRANIYQNITYAGGAGGGPTVISTNFHSSTQHIRVISSLAGWCSIDQSTGSTIVSSSTIPGVGFQIPASTVGGEYFIVTPGQFLSFCSTSTSSAYISITEMA
jgi:hypothetical protein